ncbi:MAG TPA: phage tail protein [Caldilineaceae bacterium]|nr:phage tail protein [Caldilineaceae bacterium]
MLDPSLDKIVEAIFGPLDPAPEFRYYVEIDGLVEGSFIECSGLRMQREVLEVKEGGVNDYTHKLPGRTTYGQITLSKGIMFSTKLWQWYEEGMKDGHVKKRPVTITQFSSYFNLAARWYHIEDAFPESWSVSSLRTDSSTFAVETLVLTFKTLKVEKWSMMDFASKFVPI